MGNKRNALNLINFVSYVYVLGVVNYKLLI